jgi:archaellum component FlaC
MERQPTNAELYEAIQNLHDAMNLFSNSVDGQFKGVYQHFAQIDKRFEQVDKRFEQVDKRFDRLENRVTNVEDRLGDLERGVSGLRIEMREGFERLDRRLVAVERA